MDKVKYSILYFCVWIHAIFPLGFLYILSDLLFYPLYYLVRYRRELVRKNLINSFPDKSLKEIIKIEKAFYQHFCDYFFETIKLLSISDEEMKCRFVFKNMELIEELTKNSNSCLVMLGHYGNWEWVTSITLWNKSEDAQFVQIYRPLKDKASDRFFLHLRERFHSLNIAKNDTLKAIVSMRRSGKKAVMGFISDQKPSPNSINHYWTEFLNQETAILTGTERIAKQTGYPVVYLDIRRVSRGYYEGEIKLITTQPSETAEFEITEQYTRMMEKTILRQPAYWLWSHNRWKIKRQTQI